MRTIRCRCGSRERGQILPLFAIMVTAMLLMAALLFDAGGALVTRRQLQDAADSAALAGVQQIASSGCSASTGGTPYAFVTSAVQSSLRANLPALDFSHVTVSCPASWRNSAVRVTVWDQAMLVFGGIAGLSGMRVTATATATNAEVEGTTLPAAVVVQPYSGSGTGSANGCPSFSISGSNRHVTLYAQANVIVNSACPAASGGAVTLGWNDVDYSNGAQLTAVGDIITNGGAPNPNALSRQSPMDDPVAGITEPDPSRMVLRSAANLRVSGISVLSPGIYRGGITVQGVALLQPGIYYLDGGGLDVSGGGSLYSVNTGVIVTTPLTWSLDCTAGRCGVMFFNKVYGSSDDLTVRGDVRLRPYNAAAVAAGGYVDSNYNKIGFWQSRLPTSQPNLDFGGSAFWYMDGAIYAPSAQVRIWGSSDLSAYNFSTQFIVGQLAMGGSATITLHAPTVGFAMPVSDYGLVE